ncbi:MAG: hypothetical protein K2Q24_13760 [Chitinophagaceae bacterium]|nr:hypothetical protein [Chitinophagaceae bacterium]
MKIITFFIALFMCSAVYAQSNKFDAYIIKAGADTVRGKAIYYYSSVTPSYIEFMENADVKRYYPSDIEGFYIENVGTFKTASISYHPGSLDMTLIPEEYAEEVITQQVFLELVTKGNFNLYRYEKESRRYFFIQKGDGEIEELLYRLKMKNRQLQEDKSYQSQLAKIIALNQLPQTRAAGLENLAYDKKSLGDFVSRLNGTQPKISSRKTEGFYFNAEAGVGVNLNTYATKGDVINAPINSASFSPVAAPSFHLGLVMSRDPEVSFVRYVASAGYHRNRFQGRSQTLKLPGLSYYEAYDFDLNFITLSAGAFVIIRSQSKLKYYVGLKTGVMIINNRQPDTKLIEDPSGNVYAVYKNYPVLKKTAVYGSVFTGVTYNRFRIELFGQTPVEMHKDSKANFSTTSFGITGKISLHKY